MKIEEAVKWMEEAIQETTECFEECSPALQKELVEQKEVFELALTALHSMPEAGEPLSLEQLRKMDGKPVWIEDVNRWGLVSIPEAGQFKNSPFVLFRKNGVQFEWLVEDSELTVYSYPPAHIDREAWTAKWIEDGDCEHKPHRIRDVKKWKKYKCSKCGYKAGRSNSRNYCPSCGRAMTPEAWAELERRLRG